jgi:hypothetical protein
MLSLVQKQAASPRGTLKRVYAGLMPSENKDIFEPFLRLD